MPELRSIFAGLAPVTDLEGAGPVSVRPSRRVSPVEKPVDLSASFERVGAGGCTWQAAKAGRSRGQIDLGRIYSDDDDRAAYGYAEIQSPSERKAQMVVGSDDTLTVWLNGKQVYDFADRRGFEHEQGRFDVTLHAWANRILVRCGNRGGGWQFSRRHDGRGRLRLLEGPVARWLQPRGLPRRRA